VSIQSVAIIYDDEARPDTTGVYCRRALGRLVEVEHFGPSELARIPRGRFDLYMNIDDGLRYRLPADLRPCAWWAIDTHLDLDWYQAKAPDFDLVFTAQRDGAEQLRRGGGSSAQWLPLACDPEIHRKHDVRKTLDVCFLGHIFPGERSDLVRLIQRRFPDTFVGQRFFDEMARTYSASRIVFNRSIRNDINMRVFEALACGSMLVTNDLSDNGQAELFLDGVHLAVYREAEELVDKITFYLGREALREQIAERGRAEALARHTYRHRMEAILGGAAALVAKKTVAPKAWPFGESGLPHDWSQPEGGRLAPPREPLKVQAHTAAASEYGPTSIVIVTHNELGYTRLCLESIREMTDEPYELIVVDNGSTEGTVGALREMPDVRLIENRTNCGFPAAANQGIMQARGRQILLLNNDTVVTSGWLGRLLRGLHHDHRIGLAGPCSNCVSGPQQVTADYEGLPELDGFAARWAATHDGIIEDTDRLVGFCLLIRREVVDVVGLLDEQFGLGCFEDDDYCLRAIEAGYRAVIVRDAYVHHFGGRTFLGSGIDFAALMAENERRFRAKWRVDDVAVAAGAARPGIGEQAGSGDPRRTDAVAPGDGRVFAPARKRPGPFAVKAAPGGGLRLRLDLDRPRLSLCMIVRDSGKTLPACLESIRPWVDEMVIVDTGSVDETPRIVESFGGRLFSFPWCDDFSAARNESIRLARGEWIFWMDSDDTIPLKCARMLRRLIDRAVDPNLMGYFMRVHCPAYGTDGEGDFDYEYVDHVKLFRNRPDLRFDGRIHEQILGAIRAAGGEVARTNLYVVHSGSDQSPEAQQKKVERDLRLLYLEAAERREHPYTLYNLGMTHHFAARYPEAVDYLRRAIAQTEPEVPHLRKAYSLLVHSEWKLGRPDAALDACRQGLGLFPLDTELQFRQGVILQDLGRLDEARQAYVGALSSREKWHITSADPGLSGFKTRHNLAMLAEEMGDLAEAERQWREVVREVPRYRQGWRGLGAILLKCGRINEAEGLAQELTNNEALRIEGLLLQVWTAQARGDSDLAREVLARAVTEGPDDLDTLRTRCQFCLEHGTPEETEGALKSLLERDPQDASSHHNLGTLLTRVGRSDEAIQAYRQSLRYRPNYALTYLNLGRTLKQTGRLSEAATAFEHVLRLVPHDYGLRDELARLVHAARQQGPGVR
jgi:GT2 family glycosyltransferase/tetratricopeptide (TPR) repeat protein